MYIETNIWICEYDRPCTDVISEQKIELQELQHRHEMEKSKVQHQLALEMREAEEKRRKWETEKQGELEVKEKGPLAYFTIQ